MNKAMYSYVAPGRLLFAALATCDRSLPFRSTQFLPFGGTLLSRIPEMNQEYPRRS
jgi:hypothetical protein